jgi:hypothetical protein
VLKRVDADGSISFEAVGRLETIHHQPPKTGECRYRMMYSAFADRFEISASIETTALPAPTQLIVPVIASAAETVSALDAQTVRVTKPRGVLEVRTNAARGFAPLPKERTFNLVPGFECLPLSVAMVPGEAVRITLRKL